MRRCANGLTNLHIFAFAHLQILSIFAALESGKTVKELK